jgi:hypothetical protein
LSGSDDRSVVAGQVAELLRRGDSEGAVQLLVQSFRCSPAAAKVMVANFDLATGKFGDPPDPPADYRIKYLTVLLVFGLNGRSLRLVRSLHFAKQHNVRANFDVLAAHQMAGGNPLLVVEALAEFAKRGIHQPFHRICAMDLLSKNDDRVREWARSGDPEGGFREAIRNRARHQ